MSNAKKTMTVAALLGVSLAAVPASDVAAQDVCFETPGAVYAAGDGPSSVAVGDLDGNGSLDLVIANRNGSDVSVLLNEGDGTFADDVLYAVGDGPASVAVGFLDANDSLDLAVANESSNDVSILLNAGNGTFVKQTRLVTDSPSAVAMGDLDGDDALDLVVTNALFDPCCFNIFGDCFGDYVAGTVSVFINAGDGTFPAPAGYATAKHPAAVALGDVTGDGILDVVLANVGIHPDVAFCGEGDNGASVFRNLGDGTLAAEVRYEVGQYSPTAVVVCDLDGDCALDVALAARGFYENACACWEDSGAFVLSNLGSGTFGTEVRYAPDTRPDDIAAGDFDGDGALDLVVANGMLDGVSALPNLGDGSFADEIPYTVGDGPVSVAVGDLDGNGSLDLAVASESSNDVSVLLNVCSPPCPADFSGNGSVGFADLTELLNTWGPCVDCAADLDCTNAVGFGDLTILLNSWGPC